MAWDDKNYFDRVKRTLCFWKKEDPFIAYIMVKNASLDRQYNAWKKSKEKEDKN